MATMTVNLPDDLADFVEGQVEDGDYADLSAYLTDLVRRDRENSDEESRITELRRIVEEAEASGVSTRTVHERIAEGDRIARQRGLIDG
jgi:antitoxin ParD1/3/4